MGYLVHNIDILFEMGVQSAVHLNRIFRLLFVQEEAGHVEVLSPMVVELIEHVLTGVFLLDQLS